MIILFVMFFVLCPIIEANDYSKDRFVISYDQTPTNISSWITKGDRLITGNTIIDSLNVEYQVNEFQFLFADTTAPFGRHFIFFKIDTSRSMDTLIMEYSTINGIAGVHADFISTPLVEPNDPAQNVNYFDKLHGCGIYRGWDLTVGYHNPIGIIDDGCDYTNAQLAASAVINPGEDINSDGLLTPADSNGIDDDGNGFVDDFYGWNFVANTNNVLTGGGHGTFVTSVICAATNDSIDVAGIAGGWSPNSIPTPFIQCKIYNVSDAVDALQYLCSRDVRIVNISRQFGYLNMEQQQEWVDVIEYCVIPNEVVIVAGAGNFGDEDVVAPANSPYVIAVGATELDEREWLRADFSNYGDSIALAAPGVDWYCAFTDTTHTVVSGTSISSPVVAATAALILSLDSTLSRDEVESLLTDNATPINPSEGMGAGVVNVYQSLSAVLPPLDPTITICDYTNNHPVLCISNADPDVEEIIVFRKIVTNDRYHTIIQNWTTIATSGTIDEYTDESFGHQQNGPYLAYYKVKFRDHADLLSGYSNQVSTEGYLGIAKEVQIFTCLTIPFSGTESAICIYGQFIYISDWANGLFAVQINESGLELNEVLNGYQGVQYHLPIDGNSIYAYFGSDSIAEYTLTNPFNPQNLSAGYKPEVLPYNFTVKNHILIACGIHPFGGVGLNHPVFEIIDYSNPDNIAQLYIHSQTSGYSDILVQPSYPNLVLGAGRMAYVWDLSTPSNPIMLDSLPDFTLEEIENWGDHIVSLNRDNQLEFWSLDSVGHLHQANESQFDVFQTDEFEGIAGGDTHLLVYDTDSLYFFQRDEFWTIQKVYSAQHLDIRGIKHNDQYAVVVTPDTMFVYNLHNLLPIYPPGRLTPDIAQMFPAYPNPFNPSTSIQYELPKTTDVTFTIYDILGRNIWTYQESAKPAGYYSLQWNGLNHHGKQAASGVYLISFSTPEFRAVQKAVLIR
ncbi:MAG: S8 family serine peptidase [Candidatus Marinimicrobia bacterium]|nr:S8 family serine peptidase [Candidatus Neomarinimicrobiota bacterium]